MRVLRVLLAALLLGTYSVMPVWGASAEELLAAVRSQYGAVEDLSAHFVQTSLLVASGMETEAAGDVWFARGGRMRWAYQGDDPQVIVSDGTTLWFHQVRDRTVLRRALGTLPASSRLALDLLGGFDGVEQMFALSACGEHCIELTPSRESAELSRVRVALHPDGVQVDSVTTEDALGNRTRVEFRDVRLNAGVDAAQFRFEVPEGVEVLEMEVAAP